MANVNMAKYSLVLDLNLEEVTDKLVEGQTFDDFVASNFFDSINDKLQELGIEGGIGFQHYAHHYFVNRDEKSINEEQPTKIGEL